MLIRSQPLSSKACEKFRRNDEANERTTDSKIVSQRIGLMFDRLLDSKCNTCIKTRIERKLYRVKDIFYHLKYLFRNQFVWLKTMNRIRPWEGFDGIISVMITHLRDYIRTEEKYGHSEEEYKEQKIASAKETLKLLKRMREPDDYASRRRDEVTKRYPKYKYLISEYETGGTCYSGNFVPQSNGWVGKEAGANPREGYFEFVDGRFELAASPNQDETNRLLAELAAYREEIDNAYKQAEIDSEEDFKRLGELLREHLYSWWD